MKTAYFSPFVSAYRFVLVLLFVLPLHAQQELFVSGRVLDSLSHKPLESCAVGFYNDKNQVVNGAVTDAKGYFELSLPPGRYRMVLDFIGYEKKEIPVLIRQNNQFLGTFLLSVSATELSEVE
ncbi:MAG: carboxypeptidase-like regulatory domain-containing protein, partial [Chlorobi bacterium]|nr:carboxypeptidase-like regulatory domain-containing protein [Chlorobiota bacterium]